MTANAHATAPGPSARPTPVQVLAAKVRMKADRKLNRSSPERIRSIAKTDPGTPAPKH